MKKLSLRKKVFTTKQASFIVLVVVAAISFLGSYSYLDFILKTIAYGLASELVVVLAAHFFGNK
jgi:hypothetical protein